LCSEPHLRGRAPGGVAARARLASRSPEAKLDEAIGLARAIDLAGGGSGIVAIGDIRPSTFIARARSRRSRARQNRRSDIVVMDCALSPVQQRNLEKAWGAKVLDRTGLI